MIGPEGEEVAAGQPVLGFDTTELRQRLRQSTAEADSAEKGLEKAKARSGHSASAAGAATRGGEGAASGRPS